MGDTHFDKELPNDSCFEPKKHLALQVGQIGQHSRIGRRYIFSIFLQVLVIRQVLFQRILSESFDKPPAPELHPQAQGELT